MNGYKVPIPPASDRLMNTSFRGVFVSQHPKPGTSLIFDTNADPTCSSSNTVLIVVCLGILYEIICRFLTTEIKPSQQPRLVVVDTLQVKVRAIAT